MPSYLTSFHGPSGRRLELYYPNRQTTLAPDAEHRRHYPLATAHRSSLALLIVTLPSVTAGLKIRRT